MAISRGPEGPVHIAPLSQDSLWSNVYWYYWKRHASIWPLLTVWKLHNQTLENVQSAKYLGITITDNMDWGQHVSEISSKATKTLGFLRRNLAFVTRSTKEVAYKTLVRPKLDCMQLPFGALTRNFRLIRLRKFRWQQPAGPAGDGETLAVSAKCLMSLSGHLLRPGGTSPPCFSFARFIVEQCLLKKTSICPYSQFEIYQVIT